jgi:hypothetical protein
MVKGKRQKDKQYNGQRKTRKGQKIQWPKENDKRTDNIMAKGEQQKYILFVLLSFSFEHYIVCPFFVFL